LPEKERIVKKEIFMYTRRVFKKPYTLIGKFSGMLYSLSNCCCADLASFESGYFKTTA
jgi:hypothetical protein